MASGGKDGSGGGRAGGVTGAGSEMTTQLPDGLQKFFKVTLGMTWPEGSEGGLKAMSAAWADFEEAAGNRAAEIEALIPRLKQAMGGNTADALVAYLNEVKTGLREVEAAAGEFAKMCKTAAADIQKGKIMLIAMAAMFLAMIVALLSSLFGAFAVPGTIAAGKVTLQQIWNAIVRKIMQMTWQKALTGAAQLAWHMGKYAAGGAAFMGGLDLGIQGIQIAFDGEDGISGRDEVDWNSVKGSVIGGAIGGAAFGAFHGLAKGIAGAAKGIKPPGWVRGMGTLGYAAGQIGMVAASNPLVNLATGHKDEIWAGILGGASPYHVSKGLSAKLDNAVGGFAKTALGRFGMKFDQPDIGPGGDLEKAALLANQDGSGTPDDDASSTDSFDDAFSEKAPLVIPDGPLESTGFSNNGQPITTSTSDPVGNLFTDGQQPINTTSDRQSTGNQDTSFAAAPQVSDETATFFGGSPANQPNGAFAGGQQQNSAGAGAQRGGSAIGQPGAQAGQSGTAGGNGAIQPGAGERQPGAGQQGGPVATESGPSAGARDGVDGREGGPLGTGTGPQASLENGVGGQEGGPFATESGPQAGAQNGGGREGGPLGTESGRPVGVQEGGPFATESGRPVGVESGVGGRAGNESGPSASVQDGVGGRAGNESGPAVGVRDGVGGQEGGPLATESGRSVGVESGVGGRAGNESGPLVGVQEGGPLGTESGLSVGVQDGVGGRAGNESGPSVGVRDGVGGLQGGPIAAEFGSRTGLENGAGGQQLGVGGGQQSGVGGGGVLGTGTGPQTGVQNGVGGQQGGPLPTQGGQPSGTVGGGTQSGAQAGQQSGVNGGTQQSGPQTTTQPNSQQPNSQQPNTQQAGAQQSNTGGAGPRQGVPVVTQSGPQVGIQQPDSSYVDRSGSSILDEPVPRLDIPALADNGRPHLTIDTSVANTANTPDSPVSPLTNEERQGMQSGPVSPISPALPTGPAAAPPRMDGPASPAAPHVDKAMQERLASLLDKPVEKSFSDRLVDKPVTQSPDKPTSDKPVAGRPGERPSPDRLVSSVPDRPATKAPKQEDVAAAVVAVAHLGPDNHTSGAAHTNQTPDGPGNEPLRSDEGDWQARRAGATPTRFSRERFEPHSRAGGLRAENGQVSGKITQIRYDTRHFEAAPGKWILEFTVPLDLVSPGRDVDATTRRAAAEELQNQLDKQFNYKNTWPGKGQFKGSQVHFTVEADTPNGITRGWDADPARNVPVEVRDSSTMDPFARSTVPATNQVQWDLAGPVEERLHEYFHFLGLGEGYTDNRMLFDPTTGRGGIMESLADKKLTPEQLVQIGEVHEKSRPVISHSFDDARTYTRPTPDPAAPGDLVNSIYADGPYSAQHTPTLAPKGDRDPRDRDPKRPPRDPGGPSQERPPRRQTVVDLPAMRAAADRPSRQEARDAKYGEGAWEERPVPTPARGGASEDAPVKGWSLEEAGDWFTNTMAKYFAGLPGMPEAVPFLSGGAALSRQGGVRPPKDLDFRITAAEVGFKDFSEPGGQRFLKHLNNVASKQLHNEYRAKLKTGAPRGAEVGQFDPLRKSGAGSTSMGSLNILGQEISLTVVPNARPATVRLGGDGPGADIHVLTPPELTADKLRTMISRTKMDEENVKKVAQDVFDTLDAMDLVDLPGGRVPDGTATPDTTADQVRAGLAARSTEYSETNLVGVKLQHWHGADLHALMTGHAVLTAQAHVQHGPRRRALESLLDNVREWGGKELADRLWDRLETFAKMPVTDEVRKALRPWMEQWNDRALYGPGPESRGSGRPEVRWDAAPGDEPATGAESVFPPPPVGDLLKIKADDIAANVRRELLKSEPENSRKSTADAEQIVRVLAFSGGFRPLLDSSKDAQTLEAFDLTKGKFGKAYEQLKEAGLVDPRPEGLRLRKAGWQLVPTAGPEQVVGLDGRPVDPPSSPESSPQRSPERSPERPPQPRQRSVSPIRRPPTPDELAQIELMGREAAQVLADESEPVRRGLRERARNVLFHAGWKAPSPVDTYGRAVDIVAQAMLEQDGPDMVRQIAESVAAHRGQPNGGGLAGDGVRLADDGSLARTDGSSTGALPPGATLPPAVRQQWDQARKVTRSSPLPAEMAGWISTRAQQILSNRHVLQPITTTVTPAQRDLIARDQALGTIVTEQLLRDRAAGLDVRQAERNALRVAHDLANQVRRHDTEFPNPPEAPPTPGRPSSGAGPEYWSRPVPGAPVVLTPRPAPDAGPSPERSFDFAPGSTRLADTQRDALNSLVTELAEAKTTRAGLGYQPPVVEVSGSGAHVVADALAESGVDATVTPGRAGGADVRVNWDLQRPDGYVPPAAPASVKVTDTVITSAEPQGPHPILDDPKWRHSKDTSAPWFDPKADRIPSEVIREAARTAPISGRVRGEQGGLLSDSVITPDGMRLNPWRGPIAYDVRRFSLPGVDGKPVPVQDHHVKVFLDKGDATPAQVAALEARAKAGVEELYNQGNRLANGRQFHLTVDFVPDRADAHGVVRIDESGGKENQLNWPVDLGGRKLAHEIGHFVGMHDEYFATGPVKPMLQHQDGKGRVVRDNGPMTAGLEAADARFKPRNLVLVENRMKALESTADLPAPPGDFPAPPRTPGNADRRSSLGRYLRDLFGGDRPEPASAVDTPPRIDFTPPSVARDFVADVDGVLDAVLNDFPRSAETAREELEAAGHRLDAAEDNLARVLEEHGNVASASTAPEPAAITAARDRVAVAQAALEIAARNLEVWDHQAEHGDVHYREWLDNAFTDAASLHSTDHAASVASEPSVQRPPRRLEDLLPRSEWYRLYLNPRDLGRARRLDEDNPGSYYDKDKSPGFQAGMEAAYERFLNQENFTTQRLNSQLYRQMHEAVTAQLGRRIEWSGRGSTGFPLGSAWPSPDVLSESVAGRPLMIDAASHLRAGKKTSVRPITILDTWSGPKPIVRTDYRQNEVEGIVDSVFDEFYTALGNATTDADRFRAIGRVVRTLHIVHPFEDANGRLNIHLLAPRLLLEAGFRPVIFRDLVQLFDGSRTLDQVADALARGQEMDLTARVRASAPEYSSSSESDRSSQPGGAESDRSSELSDDGPDPAATAADFPNPPSAPLSRNNFRPPIAETIAEGIEMDTLAGPSNSAAGRHDDGFWSETNDHQDAGPSRSGTHDTPLPPGAGTREAVLARLPEYMLANNGTGPSEQKSALVGADILGSISEAAPALRGNSKLQQLQDEVDSQTLSFVGDRRPPYQIFDGKTAYEVRPRAELLLDKLEVVDPTAEPGAMKSAGDNKTWSNNKQSSVREGNVSAQAMFTATPPLVVGGRVGMPAAPTVGHETVGQRKTTQSSESEVDGLHKVRVPVRVTYSILDAEGRPVGQVTDPANPQGPGQDRSVTGMVELAVPLTLGRPDPNSGPVPVRQELPSAPAIEELYSNTTAGRGFFDQASATLPVSIKEIGSTGRTDLQEFVSDANIRSNWHKMAVTEQEVRQNPEAGWVRSEPLVKGPESARWSNKASMFEMRAVARTVQVIETVPDVKSTDSRFVKDTLTKTDSTTRGVDGTVTVAAGGDLASTVYFGAGPAVGASVSKSHTMQHTDKTLTKTSVTTTGDAVRYRTEHRLEVRPLGGQTHRLAGDIVTYQSTPYDKASRAGLVPPREDVAPATPKRYPPAHVLAGRSLGGTIVDDFRGGENLYRAVADILRKLPGHKWYHLTRGDYVVEFGDIKVSPYSRGLKASVERLLGRGEQLRRDLSDEHLSELVDTMLTDRGLTFTVTPKKATFQDYVTTVTLRASLDDVRDLDTPGEFTVTGEAKEKLSSKLTDEKAVKAEAGVRPRVWHPFSTTGSSQTGILNVAKSKIWSHTDELVANSSEGTTRTHGDTLAADGTVGSRKMWPFGARLTITPEVNSYVRTSQLLRGITPGRPGKSVPDLVDLSGAGTPGPARLEPQEVQLRVLVPEVLTTGTPPAPHQPVRPENVRRMDLVPRSNELVRKAPRVLDDVDVVAVLGTDHIGNALDEQVFTASGDPIDALGPDGKTGFPRGNSRSDEDQLTPDAIRRRPGRFEPTTINRFWERRRQELSVDATVLLTPSNPVPVTPVEYQSIEKTYGAGGGISKTDKTASSFGAEAGDVVVPVSVPAGGGDTVVRFRGIFGAEVTPIDLRWGQGRAADFGGSTETTVKGAKPVRETLVWVDVTADVVAEAKYKGTIDRAEWFPGKEPGRAGVSFDLPRSMLMWATDEQIAAMRAEPASVHGVEGSGRDSDAEAPMPAPASVVGGKGVSLGLGAITTTVDARDRMRHLHRRLAENLSEEAADKLLPKSRHDAKHDNHGMVDRLLANVNRAGNVPFNGEQIAPLRQEIGRWQGKTYYLSVGARFVDPPTFSGIEHVDKLAVTDTLSTSGTTSKSSGHTVANVTALARPGIGLSARPDPAAANDRTGHGPAAGNLATGLTAEAALSRRDDERTGGTAHSHSQSAETSGPMAAYTGKIALDLRIERGLGLDEHAREVVATDSVARHDVTLLKLPEESFPAPSGGRQRLGEADPEPWTADNPRPRKITADELDQWRARPGHATITGPGFVVEHYFGDMTEFRERAGLAVARAAGRTDLDSRTAADLKATLTLPAVKTGLRNMTQGKFVASLKDWDLEVHVWLPDRPRLASVSAAVDIETKTDTQYKDGFVAKTGHTAEVTGQPIMGGGGVGHPGGANQLSEGRNNFGSMFGNTQANSVPIGAYEGVLEAEPHRTRPKDKVTTPLSAADLGKITQVDLHDVNFRFVARPKPGKWFGAGTGVAEMFVHDAFGIRHHPDRPLPEPLTEAATRLAEAGKAWTAAEKAAEGHRLRQEHGKGKGKADDALTTAEAASAKAANDYVAALENYDVQIVAARATQPVSTAAHDASHAAATAAREADNAAKAAAAATRAAEFAQAAARNQQPRIAGQARTEQTTQAAIERSAAQAAQDAPRTARDAAREAARNTGPAIMDARRGAQRHAAGIPSLREPGNPFVLDTMRASSLIATDAATRAAEAADRAAQAAQSLTQPPNTGTRGPGSAGGQESATTRQPNTTRQDTTLDSEGGFWSDDAPASPVTESGASRPVATRSGNTQAFFVPPNRVRGEGGMPDNARGVHPTDESPNRISLGSFKNADESAAFLRANRPLVPLVNKPRFDNRTPGHRTNCPAVTIQLFNTLEHGELHEAGPSAPVRTEDVERVTGLTFRKVPDYDTIDRIMSRPQVPVGAKGMVFSDQASKKGHYFLVEKLPDGRTEYIDGQDGLHANLGTNPTDIGFMLLPKGARLDPVYAPFSTSPPAPGNPTRLAAGPAPSKEQRPPVLQPGGVLAASVLSAAQQHQLKLHDAHAVVAGGGNHPVANFLDAVRGGLDPHAPAEYKRITEALDAAAARRRANFDPDAVAREAGVQVHVLRDDGSWKSYGPVTGRPVHIVDANVNGVPRFLATKQIVELGRTGVVYPGSTTTAADGANHLEHRGEFEVETIAGRNYVRVYTAVYDVAQPGSAHKHKDVHQDANGKVTPSTGGGTVAWVSGGRPLRAVQWVAKYQNDQLQKGETQPTPLLRSYLVPLDKFLEASKHARPEAVADQSATLAVDQNADANQFGVRGPDLDDLRQHALDGSLVTYVPPGSAGHARPDLSGRVEPISDLYERLGIKHDFTSTGLGHENDPWFNWGRDQDGNMRFSGFRNDPAQLRDQANRLNEMYVLWTEPEVAANQRTSAFFDQEDAIPGVQVAARQGSSRNARARLNIFVNSYGPPATNLNQVSDSIRREIGGVMKDALERHRPPVDKKRVWDELGTSIKTVASSFNRDAEMMLRGMNPLRAGQSVPHGAASLSELSRSIPHGTSHQPSFRDTVTVPVANAMADRVIADGRFAALDSTTFGRELRDVVRDRIEAHLDNHFTMLATDPQRGTALEEHANRRGAAGWLSGQRLVRFLNDVVADVRRDPAFKEAVANAPLAIDTTRVRELVQGPVIDGVRKDTVDKALSLNLVDVDPAAQRELFQQNTAGIEDSIRKRIADDSYLSLVDSRYRERLADHVSTTAADKVLDSMAQIPLRRVSHDEVDTFMRTKVSEFANMARIGASIATDALRERVDFDTRSSAREPFPNEFGTWREQHTRGYTQMSDPAVFRQHREVGDGLREVIESELTAPRPESAKKIVDELAGRIDENAPDRHDTLGRKFDEIIKQDMGETQYRSRETGPPVLYHEHAQMVLNQFLSLTRGDDDGARFVSRETMAKAILFHDMDKLNSKNQFGKDQTQHDREPEHRGAVKYMNRHEGLWSSERDFRLARAIVDSDPIGAHLRGRHDATTTYEFVRDLAHQAGRADGQEVTARDVRDFFDEFHQYYQADYSSYSNQSVFVNPKNGTVEHGKEAGFTGLARDGRTGQFVKTEDGRHFQYSSGSYQQKITELQALFDRDVETDDAARLLMTGGTPVTGVGGMASDPLTDIRYTEQEIAAHERERLRRRFDR